MVDELYAAHVVDQMRLVGERKVVQLRFVATEYDDLRIRVSRMQKQRDDVAHVAVAPYTDAIASAMGDFVEAGDSMGSHAHEFRESCHLAIHVLRKQHHALRRKDHALLHEPVETAAAEPAGPQVVLSDKFILLGGGVGKHDDDVPGPESARVVADHTADAFVDERHGQLLGQDLLAARPLVVTLVGVADGQIGWANDDLVGGVLRYDNRLDSSGGRKTIDGIQHRLGLQHRFCHAQILRIGDLDVRHVAAH